MEEPINNKQLYEQLKEVGNAIEKSEEHTLESPFIDSIVATLEYFGVNETHLDVANTVLRQDKMKIYDFLGLALSGRFTIVDDPVANKVFVRVIEKLVKLYIKQRHVGGFGWWLRGHDLELEEPQRCDDCIKSYEDWHNESPQDRRKNQERMQELYGGNIF